MVATEELKRFKNVFNGNEDFIEYYRGLYPKHKKSLNIRGLRKRKIIVLDLKEKVEKVSVLLCEIEAFGKDMSEEKAQLKEIIKVKSSTEMYSMLENMFRDLTNKYGRYVSVKKLLFSIKNETNMNIKENNLNFCIEFYLKELERLKNDDNFVNDDFSKYVGDFYLVGYDLMMKEFLLKGKSTLFDYFKNSVHDSDIIGEYINLEVDKLWENSRKFYGLNELDRVINKNGVCFNKDIIIQLLICMYPKVVTRFLYLRVQEFRNSLKVIYNRIIDNTMKHRNSKIGFIEYFKNNRKLDSEYKNILKEYEEFLSSYCYLFDGKVNSLKEDIKKMTLNIKYSNY